MGQIVEYQTGDGTVSRRSYDNMHRLETQLAMNGTTTIQDFIYEYDDFGNLTARTENKYATPMTERFTYDRLNRLDSIKLNSVASVMAYDPHGRILSKQADGQTVFSGAQYSTYDQLGNLKPHAISSATVPNGSVLTSHLEADYTTFDKVKSLKKHDSNNNAERALAYSYGYDHQRIGMEERLNNSLYRRKTYVGNCEFNHDVACIKTLTYLSAPTGVFAVNVEESSIYYADDVVVKRLLYLHKDHLGSITTITDTLGNIVQELSYDAWGNLRNPTTWNGSFTGTPLIDRGFTGHEHLYDFGLINMNGRMYDPVMSSFLSVDRYVQDPENSQNFNRYAYCLNNPLRYTDPSGEFAILDAWLSGFIQGFFSADENRLSNGWNKANQLAANDAKIIVGTVFPDMNKGFFGRHLQVLSRFSWEAPQTLLGLGLSLFNNICGQVDDVEYYDGATVMSGNFYGRTGEAVTLGCYINGYSTLSANPNNHLFQHEYGHYLQSQEMGIAYLNRVGIPSAFSNHNHKFHPVEQDANRRGFLYFNKHIDGFYKTEEDMNNEWGWDFDINPLNVDGSYTFGQYVDYKDADDLKLLEGLSIHASLIDYYGWTMSPIMLIGNTIYNTIYYNHQY